MSKIGRRPIAIGSVSVDIKGNEIHFKGKNNSGVYVLPKELRAELNEGELRIKLADGVKQSRDINRIWGMHRALLSNEIRGADVGFDKEVQITGLGYKAAISGNKVTFSLGYSHKIDFELPKEVSLKIDKTGQKLTFSSFDRQKLGQVCGLVKALRKTEPYKGTGIKLATDTIIRKAGKTKA